MHAQAALEQEAKDSAGKGKKKPPAVPRAAGGSKWWDASLMEWPENDFRIFVGDLGNEVNDDVLTRSFQKYDTFAKAKVVKDKRSNKSKGGGLCRVTHDEHTAVAEDRHAMAVTYSSSAAEHPTSMAAAAHGHLKCVTYS